MKLIKRLAGSLLKAATAITAVATLGAGIAFTPTFNLKSNSIAFEIKEQQAQASWSAAGRYLWEGGKIVAANEVYTTARYCVTEAQACNDNIRRSGEDVGRRSQETTDYARGEFDRFSQEAGRSIVDWAY